MSNYYVRTIERAAAPRSRKLREAGTGTAVSGSSASMDTSGLVTLYTDQTITGEKTFANDVIFGGEVSEGVFGSMYLPSTEGPGKYSLYVSTDPVSGETPTAPSGIDEDELWDILGGSGTEVIDLSHIPSIPTSKITGLDTALAPYATQAWVQQQGYLASVSIATISDLDSGWDALLKAAPSYYSKAEIGSLLSSYYTKTEADGRFVGVSNEQTVGGKKTFSSLLTAGGGISSTNADFSGYVSADVLYLPYSGGNKMYSLYVSTGPVSGEQPSEGIGLDEEAMWTALRAQDSSKVIDLSHIPAIPTSKITGLDSSLSSYAKKDGSNASGTWGINISGEAASATKAGYITPKQFGNQGTIGALKSSIVSAMDDGKNLKYPGQSYITSGSHVSTIMSNWSNDGFSIPAGSQEIFTRLDNYQSSTYGVFLVSGYSGGFYRLLRNDSSTWKGPFLLLDEDNYHNIADSRYVKKAGDTMTGALQFPDNVVAQGQPTIKFGSRGQIGCDATYGSWLQYGSNYIHVTNSGPKYNNTYTIWHSGNDGSGSGLDADLLDGRHDGDLTARYLNFIGNAINLNTVARNGLYDWAKSEFGSTNVPSNYGLLFQVSNTNNPSAGTNGHWVFQLGFSTNDATLFLRDRINNADWTPWATILDTRHNIYTYGKLYVPSSEGNQKYYIRFE